MGSTKPMTAKTLVFGEPGVGKSCFNDVFVTGFHFPWYDPGDSNAFRRAVDVDGEDWMVETMDVSSNLFRSEDLSLSLSPYHFFLFQADGFILLYDITSKASFDYAVDEAYRNICKMRRRNEGKRDLPYPAGMRRFACVLVGNKSDLEEQREVETEMAQEWADSMDMDFLEVDSHQQESVTDAMRILVRAIVRTKRREMEDCGMQVPSKAQLKGVQAKRTVKHVIHKILNMPEAG